MGGAWRDRTRGLVRQTGSVLNRVRWDRAERLLGWLPRSWSRRRQAVTAAAVAVGLVAGGFAGLSGALAAADPCVDPVNPIVCENSKAGTPSSVWDIGGNGGAGDSTIQGFATDISVNVGSTIDFKIKTDASAYTVDIYRLGYYGGDGARKIDTVSPSASLPQSQPACITSTATEIYDCGNWAVSASWTVPSTAVSGVYLALLTRTDTGGASHIPFVVRDDTSTSALFFQTSDTTWHAYNDYGGSDFYQGGNNGRAFKISYNRPFATRGTIAKRDYLFANEYPMIRFLERNGYDISYTTGVDSDRRGGLIKNHQVFLSVGHDEYWSKTQRTNVEAARDAGVSLAFFSGNEVYWKTYLGPSVDGTSTPNRTIVCYKDTWSSAKLDSSNDIWTGTWRDPRFSPPADGGVPENALTGTAYMSNSVDLAIQVPAAQGKNRLWRNTDIASLGTGQVATLADHTVGYESDEDLDNGFRPEGLIRLSTTTGPTPEYLRDFGSVVTPGTTTHHLTMYRASSGALVFSAGTIQWAWGLDSQHDGTATAVDSRMQQATVNLFADMGVQPGSLMSGLVAASASTDAVGPTATITSPATGTTVTNGTEVTVSGTASDTGGGVVAGVEVSTDGGTTWSQATGTTSWSYTFHTTGIGSQVVLARAIDDSANIGAPSSGLQLLLSGPSTLFGDRVPAVTSADDGNSYELGVRFTPQTDGTVTGVRFYKGTGNTGTHTGSLWTNSGSLLATGTFTGESATGWQTLTFSSPVSVTAGTKYVASYTTTTGHYASDDNFFSVSDYQAYPLTALKSSTSGNGVFAYNSGFPTEKYGDTNYYVDVTFVGSGSAAPTVVSVSPLADSTGVPISITPTVVFSKAVVSSSIAFTLTDASSAAVAGTTSYDSTLFKATFAPTVALSTGQAYTASVSADDTNGHTVTQTWSFTTDVVTGSADTVTLFAADAVPSVSADSDTSAVELGVRFTSSVDGSIVGLRFYQDPTNTGVHTGSLWTSAGALLGTLNFGTGTGSGWQTASFSSPIPISAGVEYVASYYAPNGHYSADAVFFSGAWTNGVLTAPGGSNGVYTYGDSGFPSSSYNSTNYWIDPVFVAGGTTLSASPTATTASPTPSASATTTSPTPSPSPTLTTVSPTATSTASPTTTVTAPATPVTFFDDTQTPSAASWNDSGAVELGMRFNSSVNGQITGMRFYKGSGNTGTHIGSLWSATGTLLASATFTSETDSGWQTVTFSAPVPVTAGTTYVVSYYAPNGHYAITGDFFSSDVTAGTLTAPGTANGVYRYGSTTGFPTSSYNATNYWVDVLFLAAS